MSFLPEPNNSRFPVVLCLDGSSGMSQLLRYGNNSFRRIDALNSGLEAFEYDIKNDLTAKKSVEISVIRIAKTEPDLVVDWTLAEDFIAPTIESNGLTPTAEALTMALAMCEDKIAKYKRDSLKFFTPWIIVISDGCPSNTAEKWQEVVELAQVATYNNVNIITVAVDLTFPRAIKKLSQISSYGKVYELSSHNLNEFFVWLSSSIQQVLYTTPSQFDGEKQIAEDLFE